MTSTVPASKPNLAPQNVPPAQVLLELLGAVRIFSLAVEQLVESRVQQEIAGDRLSRSQWKLLEIFALSDVRNVTDLATYQGVSTAAASKAADRLVRLGLLTREEDLEDRRHIQLRLSQEGQRLIRSYLGAIQDRINKVFARADLPATQGLSRELDGLTASIAASREELEQICLQCGSNRHEACLLKQHAGASCAFALHHRQPSKLLSEPAGRA